MDLLLGSTFPSQSNICMFVVCNFECNSSNKNVASPAGTNFGIFPQNGEALSSHSEYVTVVTGIGKEDTWYNGNTLQPFAYTDDVISNLDVFKQMNKLVLVIDYVTKQQLIDDFYLNAKTKKYVPYTSVRDLDKIIINLRYKPD
ncbi:MAG: hypothetical protein QGF64_06740 [Candidatus Poseidoniia archaeon]|nr:hypothetical protein [Candidatus Poseidoniia archaeon]